MKTEITKFDNLTSEQVGKLFPIQIVPYDPEWEILFEQEKAMINKVLSENLVVNIEHFGSTSVAGLASKPTIDIMVEVPDLSEKIKKFITEKLETIGYGNMYNAEQKNKMTFGKGYNENSTSKITYHVHIREKDNKLQDEIYFRDYLRQNSKARDEYAKLKYTLAEKYQFNREDYTQAKTEFIIKITEQQKKKTNNE
ncbi:MAG: GrpB family protein [Bacteroidales bacterium]|nr:GrpB family protein [Bacteroidales bacterium]